jgi:hypothetical protein
MNLFEVPDVTISVNRYTDLIRIEKAFELIKKYVIVNDYMDKDDLMLLLDLNEEKESKDDE